VKNGVLFDILYKDMKYGFGFFIGVCAVLFCVPLVHAAGPTFLVSWEAQNNAPIWFMGKKLPTHQSSIVVSFDVVSGGKIVDLSSRQVRWYINGRLSRRQNGLQTITIKNNAIAGSSIDVRISPQLYDSTTGADRFVDYSFSIPIVSPEVVVSLGGFWGSMGKGALLNLSAYPFFFNSDDAQLDIQWKLDGKSVSDGGANPFLLAMQIADSIVSGRSTIMFSASDPSDVFNTASVSKNILIK